MIKLPLLESSWRIGHRAQWVILQFECVRSPASLSGVLYVTPVRPRRLVQPGPGT